MRRVSWLLVVSACAFGAVVACGDTTNVTNVVVAGDGGDGDVDGGGDSGKQPKDGGNPSADASEDSATPDDGSVCNVGPTGTASEDCAAVEACGVTTCAAGPKAVLYACADGGRPNLPNCFQADAGACCAPACVRRTSTDTACDGAGGGLTKAYSCANVGGGQFDRALLPSTTCAITTTANPNAILACCP